MKPNRNTSSLASHLAQKFAKGLGLALISSTLVLTACGGGGTCSDAPLATYTAQQIPNLTRAEALALRDIEIIAMGSNFKLLSNQSLSLLKDGVIQLDLACPRHIPNMEAISPEQIASLTPAQVRFLGSDGTGVAKLDGLSYPTFERLMSDPQQVAALTTREFDRLPSNHFTLIGLNIKHLSDPVLSTFKDVYIPSRVNLVDPIKSITPAQVDLLSTHQIRLLGTASRGTPRYMRLADATFERMMQRVDNVQSVTSADLAEFDNMNISLMGTNITLMSDEIIGSLTHTYRATPTTTTSQVGALTFSQVAAFSPNQMALIINGYDAKGIGSISTTAFAALKPEHLTNLLPVNISRIKAEQLAKLTVSAISAMPLDTRLAFTTTQKALLTSVQKPLFQAPAQ